MKFPISDCSGIPINFHPGAFGFHRKNNWHLGVDLYTNDSEPVIAIEYGTVVAKGIFTGPEVGTPWWETTYYLMIEGDTGVFNYGEIYETSHKIGTKIVEGNIIAKVKRVLFKHKLRKDIPGHSTSMLHLELYTHGSVEPVHWHQFEKPANLLDPTPYLLQTAEHPWQSFLLTSWDNSSGKKVG